MIVRVKNKTGEVNLVQYPNLTFVECAANEKLRLYVDPASPIYKYFHDRSLVHIEPLFDSKKSTIYDIPARYYITGWAINSIDPNDRKDIISN